MKKLSLNTNSHKRRKTDGPIDEAKSSEELKLIRGNTKEETARQQRGVMHLCIGQLRAC